MIEFDDSKAKLAELTKVIAEVADALDVPALEKRKAELEAEQNEDGFWTDQARSQRVNKELKQVSDKLRKVKKLQEGAADLEVLIELAESEEALSELPAIEEEIMKSVKTTEQGSYISFDPERAQGLMNSTKEEIEKLENMGQNPIVVTSPIVRLYYKKLTKDYFPDLTVISYNEIDSDVELQSVGMVTA